MAQPKQRGAPRAGVLASMEEGKVVKEAALQAGLADVERLAKHHLHKDDVPIVINNRMEQELAALAEHLLVEAAFWTIQETPATWTKSQAARVRAPFELFGVSRLADIEDPAKLRAAVLVEYGDGEEASEIEEEQTTKAKEAAKKAIDPQAQVIEAPEAVPVWSSALVNITIQSVMHAVKIDATDSKTTTTIVRDPRTDPRAAIILLAPASNRVLFSKNPMRLDQIRFGRGFKLDPENTCCAVTWRRLEAHDKVRGVYMAFDSQQPEQPQPHQPEGDSERLTADQIESMVPKTYPYVGVMDHGYVHDRLPHGHPRKTKKRKLRVSALGMRLITFARASEWITENYRSTFQDSLNAVSGMLSHEVLSKQRSARSAKGGAAKRPAVLKKNKPDQWEQLFAAWEDCTFSDSAVEQIVELYIEFKRLQIAFFSSCRLLHDIRKAQTTTTA